MKNHYQTLGVNPSATAEEIKNAYKRLSKKVHPDMNWGESIFEEIFKNVNEAYQVLGDEQERRKYNDKYNHFFFSTGQQIARQASFATPPPSYYPPANNLRRKFIMNGAICLLLMFVFMGVNAFMFKSEEIVANHSAPISIKKNLEPIRNEEKIIAASLKEIIPVRTEAKEFKEESKGSKTKSITGKAAIITNKKEPLAEFKKKILKTKDINLNSSASAAKTRSKVQWTEAEMLEVVEKVKAAKVKAGSNVTCIKLLQSGNSNISNGFGVANYLQINNFSIAGRLTIAKDVNGVQIEFDRNGCMTVTIGFVQ